MKKYKAQFVDAINGNKENSTQNGGSDNVEPLLPVEERGRFERLKDGFVEGTQKVRQSIGKGLQIKRRQERIEKNARNKKNKVSLLKMKKNLMI